MNWDKVYTIVMIICIICMVGSIIFTFWAVQLNSCSSELMLARAEGYDFVNYDHHIKNTCGNPFCRVVVNMDRICNK